MKGTRMSKGVVWAMALLVAGASPALAQSSSPAERPSSESARASIERRIAELESQIAWERDSEGRESVRSELEYLRSRLAEGDFRPGDAIALEVRGEDTLTATFTVEPPRQVRLPGFEPIDLTGVLRGELQGYMQSELGKYLRDPVVKAIPLMRVGVLGAVGSPGYYAFPLDARLTDIFGAAGGLARNAEIEKVELRRLGERVVEPDEMRRAMAQGYSLQQIEARPGDEVFVPEQGPRISPRDWIFITSGAVGLLITVLSTAGAI